MMVFVQRVCLILKKIQGLRRGSIIKFQPSYVRLMRIRYKNLGSKREGVQNHKIRSLHVPSVERVILVNASLERAIVFFSRVSTRLRIFLILRVKIKVVKLKKVVLMMILRRIAYML